MSAAKMIHAMIRRKPGTRYRRAFLHVKKDQRHLEFNRVFIGLQPVGISGDQTASVKENS